jgi:HEAT repeat protein
MDGNEGFNVTAMKTKVILLLAQFVVLTMGHGLGEMGADDALSQLEADRLVEQMRGFSMQENPAPPGNRTIEPAEQRREGIVKKLRLLGKESLPALIHALHDSDVQMRRNAALILTDLSGRWEAKPRVDIREVIPALIKGTDDHDPDVRAWAAEALATIGPDAKEAIPALTRLIKDSFEGARNNSCFALGEIGSAAKSALSVLHDALNDPSKDVRRFAQRAIEKIQSE